MNLYIYKYNNYYNRIVKKEDNFSDYGIPIHSLINCRDFNPNDGVNTQHVFGSAANDYDGSGDYLIVTDENNEIISRWFIIEINFTRKSQWFLLLRRDLVVDYYDSIVNAPCFIEKATLSSDSPFVFNNENASFNQIKTAETLLKDKSDCAWIVGYYDKGSEALTGTVPTNGSDIAFIQLSTNIEDWEYYKYTTSASVTQYFASYPTSGYYRIRASWLPSQVTFSTPYRFDTSIFSTYADTTAKIEGGDSQKDWGLYFPGTYGTNNAAVVTNAANRLANQFTSAKLQALKSQILYYTPDNVYSQQDTDELLYTLNGAIIKDLEGKFFKVNVRAAGNQTGTINLTGQMRIDLKDLALAAGFTQTGDKSGYYQLVYTSTKYQIELIEQFDLETTYNITGNKLITTDAPWNIFAIPYSDTLTVKNGINNETILQTTSKDIAINTAMAMQTDQSSRIYDIQLLPYCPIPNLVTDIGEITVTNEKEYSLIQSGGETPQTLGIIFNIAESRFSINLEGYSIISGQTAIEKKINNECDKWRLASPNYSNYFDFSVEKNNGVSYFNVDCEYKPFTPYIHLNPNFSNLYGEDFNDARGLICGGDFSLSQIIDQWEQYQVQNKNFQNIFDRQIENMEVNNSIARTQEKWSIGAGVGSGAVSGALTGSLIGGPTGGILGGILGGAASLAGGIADYQMNEQLRNEALDYTKDLFGYQLSNIQAMPNTIGKISAFNNNNKVFPILEYYTCTNEEKEALANKIAYNGMTIMIIGTIVNYIGNQWSYNNITSKGYIKGKIIRIEDIEDDYHLLKSISEEIYKGVYF